MTTKATRFELQVSEDFKERVLQNHHATPVVPEFFDELLAGLEQPPEPNEALSRAFAQARDVVERG